jgi:hypothetical protein
MEIKIKSYCIPNLAKVLFLILLVILGVQLTLNAQGTYDATEINLENTDGISSAPQQIGLPEFTTFDRVMRLSKGLTKAEVLAILEVYPYKIVYNENNDCEINVFKCGIARRSLELKSEPREGPDEQLSKGETFFTKDLQNIVVFYQSGQLFMFVNQNREEEAYKLLNLDRYVSDHCSPDKPVQSINSIRFTPIIGCMDSSSLNYNPLATIEKDGSCEYPKCGYVKLHLTPSERKSCLVTQIPGDELWNYWILDGRCKELREAVESYPHLSKKLPKDFFVNCNPNQKETNKDCDWCDVIKNKGSLSPTQVQFNLSK